MKIALVVGARPNLVKIAAIVREIARWPELVPVLIHTGQHYDPSMSEVFFQELGIPPANHNLGVSGGSVNHQTAHIMLALEPLFAELGPDVVLVVGDVNSTVAAALVSARLGLPLVHVEAGLRSFDRTMPEEINRIVTDSLTDFFFTTEQSANDNLVREGARPERIALVGNVMIDTLMAQRERASALDVPGRLGLTPGGYAFMTLHRPSNVDVPAVLDGVLTAVEALQAKLPFVFPVHPRTRKRLAELGFAQRCERMANVRWLEPVGYLEALGLMGSARLVLTDSGGVQEETTVLGVPCLTLRENTERPITVTDGSNELVGTRTERILEGARRALAGERGAPRVPPFWDGKAAERIVAILRARSAEIVGGRAPR